MGGKKLESTYRQQQRSMIMTLAKVKCEARKKGWPMIIISLLEWKMWPVLPHCYTHWGDYQIPPFTPTFAEILSNLLFIKSNEWSYLSFHYRSNYKKKCNVCTLLGTQEYLSPGNLSHNLQYCKERIELYIYCQKISSKISCVLPKSIWNCALKKAIC